MSRERRQSPRELGQSLLHHIWSRQDSFAYGYHCRVVAYLITSDLALADDYDVSRPARWPTHGVGHRPSVTVH